MFSLSRVLCVCVCVCLFPHCFLTVLLYNSVLSLFLYVSLIQLFSVFFRAVFLDIFSYCVFHLDLFLPPYVSVCFRFNFTAGIAQ
jgi:hypothetical protein